MNVRNVIRNQQMITTVEAVKTIQERKKINTKEASMILYKRSRHRKTDLGFKCKSFRSFYNRILLVKNSNLLESEEK